MLSDSISPIESGVFLVKMNKNKCQAYTKKKIPCKNFAMEGSDFCPIHEGLFKDFPPVKITALICPYCDEPIERNAKFCNLCKHYFQICPYCDEPLRQDAKFCRFCKEDLAPAKPKLDKPNYYVKLFDIRKRIAAIGKDISYGCFLVAVFLLITGIVFFMVIGIFLDLTQ